MASKIGICNRALEKLGGGYITSIGDNSNQAKALNRCYDYVLDAVLQSHPWNFAKMRVGLPALVATPAWGYAAAYQLPADCLRLLEIENGDTFNWALEGRTILTDEGAPLNILYIYRATDPNQYEALFIEAFASKLAYEIAEDLSSSNTKRKLADDDYVAAMMLAKRINGQQQPPDELPESPWLLSRN